MKTKVVLFLNAIILITSFTMVSLQVSAKEAEVGECISLPGGWKKGTCCQKCPSDPNYGERWNTGGDQNAICRPIINCD